MPKINIFSSFVALLIATSLTVCAQDAKEAIQKKIAADYAVTQATADNTDIVTAGAVLVIKKGRIMMAPTAGSNLYQNTYKDGTISQNAKGKLDSKLEKWRHISLPGTPVAPTSGADSRTFVPGEKLWVTQIEVKEDGVVFSLLSDPFGEVRYKGSLKFAFTKGSYPTPDVADHTVAEVFNIQPTEEAKGQQAQGGQAGGQQPAAAPAPPAPAAAEAPPAPIAPPPPPADQPAAPTKTISLGQTMDQVVAILGAPQKDIKLGTKEIYSYPDLKVTFIHGKVSDVQ